MNMKKTLCLIAILVLVVTITAACSSTDAKNQNQTPEATQQAENETQSNEQAVESQMYFGKVKQIIGNEVTLELAENPLDDYEDESGANDTAENGSGDMAAVEMTEALPAGSAADTPVEEHMELTYTGEEMNFTIPAGVQIYSLSHGQYVQLSSLQKGSVLSITVQGDSNVVSEVEIWE